MLGEPTEEYTQGGLMLERLKSFERIITFVLIGMMIVVVLLATLELGWIIIKDIITPPVLILEIDELLEIFGLFLLVLIGIELLETIKSYLHDQVLRVEVVLSVALIAIARKVIILDIKGTSNMTLVGIGVIIAALAGAYYLFKRSKNIR
jgi:LPXTG-motif cell wall-anchored protein